jgi:di/tricarboxylate transporter
MLNQRRLEDEEEPPPPQWETIYVSIVLALMFVVLFMDKFGPDAIMMTVLTLMLAPGIITVTEALAGFSSSGLWTVMVLFVIAEALNKTGAFGWYMTKLLGKPKTIASAQLRLMLPITVVSAFLNNSPIVVVMIPIVQQWAIQARLDIRQLLIPLSWATILGGTITLIGTSTNLVVLGQYDKAFPDGEPITLFDISVYGVPNALMGLSYILLACPFILGRGRKGAKAAGTDDPILLGAKVSPWSPAAGRSVQRSGLRDSGGIYLVSVVRAQTGHVHRAVSGEFILNVGDVLYFTGLVESFGDFCSEHGLEVLTNETSNDGEGRPVERSVESGDGVVAMTVDADAHMPTTVQANDVPIGVTRESLLQASRGDRLRCLAIMSDLVRGYTPPTSEEAGPYHRVNFVALGQDPPQVVVEYSENDNLVCVGINCSDRQGLLLDISKALLRLNLQLKNTEARVVDDRSISIWRCESVLTEGAARELRVTDLEEVWTVLIALLSPDSGVQAIKQRGLRVIRAQVTKDSRLVDKSAGDSDVKFRAWYRAAIVAVQQADGQGQNTTNLTAVKFKQGDVLILQVSDDSPLLRTPTVDENVANKASTAPRHTSSLMSSFIGRSVDSNSDAATLEVDAEAGTSGSHDEDRAAWDDLQVLSHLADASEGDAPDSNPNSATPEFLAAMRVSGKAGWIGKTAKEVGFNTLHNLVLVDIERPSYASLHGSDFEGSVSSDKRSLQTIPPDAPLEAGDVLWFSGQASAIGNLRKIPGLVSYEHDEVKKLNEKVHDRRLVQAVVARMGPLVGKTIKEARFRTRYGAAVISVQREGKRVHELPSKIKLQAGDVLLLEAGPSFLGRNPQDDAAFALLSEVKDSAPPRLRLLIPTIVIVVAAIVVYVAGVTSLLVSMLVAAILLVLIGVISEQEARQSLNWTIFVTIGAAFGISSGLVNSGVAPGIAAFIVRIGNASGLGNAGVIAGIYFTTVLVGNALTSNATAALIFPIAMEAASQTGVDPKLMSFALMLAASANFMSPYAYTTNLLVFGPGKYKYKDFLFFGTPLQLVLWISATAILTVSPWYNSWIVSAAVFAGVTFVRVLYASLKSWCGDKAEAEPLTANLQSGAVNVHGTASEYGSF